MKFEDLKEGKIAVLRTRGKQKILEISRSHIMFKSVEEDRKDKPSWLMGRHLITDDLKYEPNHDYDIVDVLD